MAFLTKNQVDAHGFKRVGRDVEISDKAAIYNPCAIEIGDFSRVDDFCVLSPGADGLSIGRNVHIAVFCSLIGKARIELADFSGLSSRVSIYSSSDDYSGTVMTNPTIAAEYTGVISAAVVLQKHVIVGAGTIILPGVTLFEGAAVGALSLVTRDCEAFSLYFGNPAKRIKDRRRDLLDLEQKMLSRDSSGT
jgi:acetyltransferase-like isoleucine patch superfamily enzyme